MNAPAIAETLAAASAELAADNRAAEIEQDKRDWKKLEHLIDKFGLCNVVGIVADYAQEKANRHPEDSAPYADFMLAYTILDAAARGVDLAYASEQPTSLRAHFRELATESMQALALEISV